MLLNFVKSNLVKNKAFISIGKIASKIPLKRNYIDLIFLSIKDCLEISIKNQNIKKYGIYQCIAMLSKSYSKVFFY
jgi:hypothetical protein